MKSILISIQPKWCGLIASGKKTIEVRKSKPNTDVPFKCYIYCTSSNVHECLLQNETGAKLIHTINYKTAIPVGGYVGNGKVIGEFVCDKVVDMRDIGGEEFYSKSCMTYEDWRNYTDYTNHVIWNWHISNLVIYDKPKELSEFIGIRYLKNGFEVRELERPPQSWCYVEGAEAK